MRISHTWRGFEQLTACARRKFELSSRELFFQMNNGTVQGPYIFSAFCKVQGMELPIPEPNDWAKHFPKVPRLARPIHVAMPCCGIDGAGWALKSLGANFHCNNVFDLEHRYKGYLEEYMPDSEPPRLGAKDGDVLQQDLSSWERPVHILVAGPPCPPWAGNGNHKGADDQRAAVFLNIVNVVASLAKCGELQATVLENVKGILHRQKGQAESFMGKLLSCLEAEIPEFLWDVSVLKAKDYCLAQDRTRVFLRGVRSSLCPATGVPEVLPAFGSKTLKEFLVPGMPPVDRATLTTCMRKNLDDAQDQLRNLLEKGELSKDDLVCYPLDRADGKCYKRQVCKDKVPTLTTSNSYLFVSDAQVEKEDHQRAFFRFLLPEERFTLQGFPAKIASSFKSQALQIKAAGNAYPVPLIGAALAGIVKRIGKNDLPQVDKPLEEQTALRCRLEEAMFGPKKAPGKQKEKKKENKTPKKKENKTPKKKEKITPKKKAAMKKPASKATASKEQAQTPEEGPEAAKPTEDPPVKKVRRGPAAVDQPVAAWRVKGFLDSSSSSS